MYVNYKAKLGINEWKIVLLIGTSAKLMAGSLSTSMKFSSSSVLEGS